MCIYFFFYYYYVGKINTMKVSGLNVILYSLAFHCMDKTNEILKNIIFNGFIFGF